MHVGRGVVLRVYGYRKENWQSADIENAMAINAHTKPSSQSPRTQGDCR